MINKQSLLALLALLAINPTTIFADMEHKPPMAFCKKGTCDHDDSNCPASITNSGTGYPACEVYNTDTVLEVGTFDAAPGG